MRARCCSTTTGMGQNRDKEPNIVSACGMEGKAKTLSQRDLYALCESAWGEWKMLCRVAENSRKVRRV